MWRTPLTGCRVPIPDICRHFAFSAFLEHKMPSRGLPTIMTWDCVSVLVSILAAVLPATRTVIRKGSRSTGGGGVAWPISQSDQQNLRQDSKAQTPSRNTTDPSKNLTDLSKSPDSHLTSPLPTYAPPSHLLASSSTSVSSDMHGTIGLREFA